MKPNILITGGAGYIGSQTVLQMIKVGYSVTVVDNLSNSSKRSLDRISEITGAEIDFVKADVRDENALNKIFERKRIDAVLHFAGLKSVKNSVEEPLDYYDNNVAGTLSLCKAMVRAEVFSLVFSSSATIYGDAVTMPINEEHPKGKPTNPYGNSKSITENILMDIAAADNRWKIALLRYFNPVGADKSGRIGEDPRGVPNNLIPYLTQVAIGKLSSLSIFGNDYPTPDGTGVRDFIHVIDLAEGHISALSKIQKLSGIHAWNLGTGYGHSVLDVIQEFENITGIKIKYKFVPRRPGDIAICYADPGKAEKDLKWRAKYKLAEQIQDAWRWQIMNPNGYETKN